MFSVFKNIANRLEAVQRGVSQLQIGQNTSITQLVQLTDKVSIIMADLGALQTAVLSLSNDIPAVLDYLQKTIAENTSLKGGTVDQAQVDELNKLDASIKSALANVTSAASAPVVAQPTGEPTTNPTDTTSATGTGTTAGGTATETGSTASTAQATSTSEPATSMSETASEGTHIDEPTEENTSPHV